MSDSETSESSDSFSESDGGDQEDVPDVSDGEWSDYDDDGVVEDGPQDTTKVEIDVSRMVLCKKHKPGKMLPHSCTTCAAAVGLFKDKAVIEKIVLKGQASASSSSLVSRYNGRCDTAAQAAAIIII